MLRLAAAAVFSFTLTCAAQAQSVAPIDTLMRALGLPEIIEIMREEGISYGAEMQDDFLGGRGGARWPEAVAEIYDTDRLTEIVRQGMDRALAAEDLAPMIAFFDSEMGQRIVGLEVSARRAFLIDGIEESSIEVLGKMMADKDPRLDLVKELAVAGDLIDNNVVGALNSNYAFYLGLAAGNALPAGMTEAEILTDVWSQEAEIREETTEWLYSYLNMAYQPLSDEELQTYIRFFQSPEGRELNAAIFASFDKMFVEVSGGLGRAAANFLAGEEL